MLQMARDPTLLLNAINTLPFLRIAYLDPEILEGNLILLNNISYSKRTCSMTSEYLLKGELQIQGSDQHQILECHLPVKSKK